MYNAVKSDVNKVDISANEGPDSTKAQDHVSNSTQLGLAGGTEPHSGFPWHGTRHCDSVPGPWQVDK